MENIIIPAHKNDAVLLKNIADVSFDKKFQKGIETYESYFKEGCHCFLLMNEGLPVGELILLPEDEKVTIKSMAIVPSYRKNGLSKKLLDFAEYNASMVKVEVNSHNKKAIDFYKKNGYTVTKNTGGLAYLEKNR